MSDLVSNEFVTAAPASGGAKIVVEEYVDSSDGLTKTLPISAIAWGTRGGDYFWANQSTPLPTDLYASGVALESATADPGASDVGLIVRVAGVVNQGDPAAISDAWMTKLTNGSIAATLTTVSSKNCLDVNVVGGGGGGTSIVDDAVFTVGTTSVTPAAGTYRSTRDSVDDGDAGAFAMTLKRAIYVSMETPNADSVLNDTWNSVVNSDAFPASTTGVISASGATSSVAVDGLGTVSVSLTGTCSSIDFTFEVSNDGGTEWSAVYAVRRDTNAFDSGPVGLALSSETAVWQVDVKGMTHFRLNVSSYVSYTNLDYVIQSVAGPFTTNPSSAGGGGGGSSMTDDAAFLVGTDSFTVSGGTYRSTRDTVNSGDAGAFAMTASRAIYSSLETPNSDSAMDDTDDAVKVVSPDNSVANFIAATGTNLTTVKASAGVLAGYTFTNNSASPVFVRFYDASSPTVGTTSPKLGPIMVPANGGVNSPSTDLKVRFATAIKFSATSGMANSDTGAISANDVCGFCIYR